MHARHVIAASRVTRPLAHLLPGLLHRPRPLLLNLVDEDVIIRAGTLLALNVLFQRDFDVIGAGAGSATPRPTPCPTPRPTPPTGPGLRKPAEGRRNRLKVAETG